MKKSKTKQTIAPEIFRELQDILKYHRIYRGSQMRYTKPFLCVRMLELSGSKEDASDLLNEVRPQSGKYGALDEKDWICLDASVWLATCILELDPQMELGDQVDKHPWEKEHDLRVFKCVLAICVMPLNVIISMHNLCSCLPVWHYVDVASCADRESVLIFALVYVHTSVVTCEGCIKNMILGVDHVLCRNCGVPCMDSSPEILVSLVNMQCYTDHVHTKSVVDPKNTWRAT